MQEHNFEPMGVGGILDRTFKLYKNNFVTFIAIVAIVQVPVSLLIWSSSFLIGMGMETRYSSYDVEYYEEGGFEEDTPEVEYYGESGPVYGEEEYDPRAAIAGGIGFFVAILISIVGTTLSNGALTKSVSEYYLGRNMTVGKAYKYVLPKLLTLLGAGLLVGIVTMFGYMLLIVPGVIFSLWFALTVPAIVTEDKKATAGMARSKHLASGNLGKIFSVLFLIVVLSFIVSTAFQFIGGGVGAKLFAGNIYLSSFFNQIISLIGQILVAPISLIAMILLYYDMRIRKEGFDLQMLASSISGPSENPQDV